MVFNFKYLQTVRSVALGVVEAPEQHCRQVGIAELLHRPTALHTVSNHIEVSTLDFGQKCVFVQSVYSGFKETKHCHSGRPPQCGEGTK